MKKKCESLKREKSCNVNNPQRKEGSEKREQVVVKISTFLG